MEQVGNILYKCLREFGIHRPIMRYQALALWPKIVGKKISEVTEPQRFNNGKIFIKVKNDSWRNELVFHKQEIINKINKAIGSRIVEEIILI